MYSQPPNNVNVFETGITLPGRAELDHSVTGPCRPHLYAVFSSSGSIKLPDPRSTDHKNGATFLNKMARLHISTAVGADVGVSWPTDQTCGTNSTALMYRRRIWCTFIQCLQLSASDTSTSRRRKMCVHWVTLRQTYVELIYYYYYYY